MLILSSSATTTSQGIPLFYFFREKKHAHIRTPSACFKTQSSAQRVTNRPTTVTRSRSAGTDRLSITDSPLKRSSTLKDIIPVPPAHSRQGLCRRLGRAKGNLGWNVPPIPKGSLLRSWSPDTISNTSWRQADISESSILITEPYFNLPQVQRIYDQFIFEEYGFQSYYRCTRSCILNSKKTCHKLTPLQTAASLIPHGALFTAPHKTPNGDTPPPPECMLVIDSGFSFTHIVPLISGSIVWNAVKR